MRLALVVLIAALVGGPVLAQSTRPARDEVAGLELRATTALNRGDHAMALSILRRLEPMLKDDPDRLGRVQEQIRVCQRELASRGPGGVEIAAPTDDPTAVEMSAAKRTPHPAPNAGEVRELSIKQLGNFEYDGDTGGNVPADVLALSGSSIRVRGFMIPVDQAANITQFMLVPDLFACCFGQPPQLQHTIVVSCPPGKSVGYYPDELVVEGTLRVEEKTEDGFVISLFEVDVTSVKPAVK